MTRRRPLRDRRAIGIAVATRRCPRRRSLTVVVRAGVADATRPSLTPSVVRRSDRVTSVRSHHRVRQLSRFSNARHAADRATFGLHYSPAADSPVRSDGVAFPARINCEKQGYIGIRSSKVGAYYKEIRAVSGPDSAFAFTCIPERVKLLPGSEWDPNTSSLQRGQGRPERSWNARTG